jgi:TonB-dependent SusC/RagA subfamily outer membrane receptor
MRSLAAVCISIGTVVAVLPTVAAAQTGTITGIVQETGSRQPVAAAQVSLPELGVGSLAQNNGRYLILSVPVGTHRIQVQVIGYGTEEREVTVAQGTTIVNFELSLRAITLDEIVVTGSGVAEQRRQLGVSISTVDARAIALNPGASVTELLTGRVPGLLPTISGESGKGVQLRIRGQTSMTQRNEPILVLDGIRLDAAHSGTGRLSSTRLDDINPADIERIEVIKGAAAATLFGTEASSGVIQIFTKSGSEGEARYSFTMDQGAIQLPPDRFRPIFAYDDENHRLLSNNPSEAFLRTGHRQNYSLSVSGGTSDNAYYLSGRFMDETGGTLNSGERNMALRASFDTNHTEKLRTEVGVYAIRDQVQTFVGGGFIFAHTLANPLGATERLPYGEQYSSVADGLNGDARSKVDNLIVNATTTYQWTPNLSSRFVLGYNTVYETSTQIMEKGQGLLNYPTGLRDVAKATRRHLTVDFNTSWDGQLSDRFGFRTWGGAQMFSEKSERTATQVQDFAAPGLKTLSGGATITAFGEAFQEVVNAGVFTQGQLDYEDRLIFTAGLRADGNSAFGEDFGMSLYPKVSLSYVLSDEPFWPEDVLGLSLVRLRGAYGTSGLQPGAFDAVQTWQPQVRLDGKSVISPTNVGNPDLKPERSTERELGADLGFFDDRLGLELTYFWQTTEDAILGRPLSPTVGFSEPQLINVAAMKSRGLEAVVNWAAIQRPNFGWNLSASAATLDQKITDLGLGDLTRIKFDYLSSLAHEYLAEGYQPGANIGPTLDPHNPYELSVPIAEFTDLNQLTPNKLKNAAGVDSLVFLGNQIPSFTGTFSTEFRLPGGFNLRAQFTGIAGAVTFTEIGSLMYRTGTRKERAELEFEVADPSTTTERRGEIAEIHARKHSAVHSNWVYPSDYIRFRELSLGYPVPQSLADLMGLTNLRVTLQATNLMLWTSFDPWHFADPGQTRRVRPSRDFGTGLPRTHSIISTSDWFQLPSARRLTLRFQGGW